MAGFIGAPPMNLFAARVLEGGAGLMAEGVRFPAALRLPHLEGARELRLGLRPENLRLDASEQGGAISGVAEVVEPVGGELYVYWKTGVGTLISRESDQQEIRPGEQRELRFAAEALHFFDPESGLALRLA